MKLVAKWVIMAGVVCGSQLTAPASAQYYGYGFPSPSLNIITNSVANQAFTQSVLNPPAKDSPRAPTANPATLRFTPNLAVRQKNFAAWITQARALNGDAAASSLGAVLSPDANIIKVSAGVIAPLGLRTDHIADAMAFYLIAHWMAARGTTDVPTHAQATALSRQISGTMLSKGDIPAMASAKKQELAEQMLVQAMLIAGAMQGAEGNAAATADISRQAVATLKEMGIDAAAVMLGPNGFETAN